MNFLPFLGYLRLVCLVCGLEGGVLTLFVAGGLKHG
jgi:hypothetical protein